MPEPLFEGAPFGCHDGDRTVEGAGDRIGKSRFQHAYTHTHIFVTRDIEVIEGFIQSKRRDGPNRRLTRLSMFPKVVQCHQTLGNTAEFSQRQALKMYEVREQEQAD